jgi:DNA modification methylase
MDRPEQASLRLYYNAEFGQIYLGDSLQVLPTYVPAQSVDLIMTSPPFGLVRKKDYGNADANDYLEWFKPFAREFKKVLKPNGSLVIDIGGSWIQGQPTRSLYHFKLLIMLVEEFGFHLAQEFYWWSPSRLPTPAEWVTVRRIRVKDAVNCVWWLSPSPWPRANNARVLQPYSDAQEVLFKKGYKAKLRPSGHNISEKFGINNGGAIPPNLLAMPNTDSNGYYLRYCRAKGIKEHPARYPSELPEFFIRMLTNEGDFVLDPFAGSCVTGEVCERLRRKWVCSELDEEYVRGAIARFKYEELAEPADGNNEETVEQGEKKPRKKPNGNGQTKPKGRVRYSLWRPGTLWGELEETTLPTDGGKERRITQLSKMQSSNGTAAKAEEAPLEHADSVENLGGEGDKTVKVDKTGQLRLLEKPSHFESTQS